MGLSQRYLKEEMSVDVGGPGVGTVLEVKEARGFGTTVDAVVYDGTIREDDTIVVGGLNGPIVTDVRALLKPKPLAEQVVRLKELHPQLKDVEVADSGELPAGAEGWFAIPNIWKADSILTGNYNDSVKRVLDLIKQDRNGKFHNYRDGQLGPERLRQSARAEATMLKLSEEQGHPDILVIACQFGITHRGRSVRRAREVMVDQNQFGLGAFAVGIMILTHPDRLKHYDDLWIDCAGDEFDDPGADVRFDHAPYFRFHGGKVKFGARWTDSAVDGYGSASGCLPKCLSDTKSIRMGCFLLSFD
jgi:hypothetical protein